MVRVQGLGVRPLIQEVWTKPFLLGLFSGGRRSRGGGGKERQGAAK